ncbi:MAG: terminase [Negativicutes bacterium]|nr:terminase [Negativicutes bacterium]
MAKRPTIDPEEDEQLLLDMVGFYDDPYGFVLYSFDWGQGDLKGQPGPDKWQTRMLKYITERLQEKEIDIGEAIDLVVKTAVASGHGIGKSALVAWLILWAMATMEDTRGVVTAGTDRQLRTKTWPELSTWYNRFIAKHWFTLTATSIHSSDKEHEHTWRIDIIPWSENNTEAFAGLHNKGKRILLLFDEASSIADKIWEVAEGAMTDENTQIIWACFGNPTRNTGRFFDCFKGKFRHRWKAWHVDSRESRITNKRDIQQKIDDYGIDSDYVKIRVLGQFPSTSDRQFIPNGVVDAACGRHYDPHQYNFAPVIITCDPAWGGGDELVIAKRQGLWFTILRTFPTNNNDIVIAGYLAEEEDKWNADAVIIDQGYGTGIYSAGVTMGRDWMLVNFGWASGRIDCALKRDEMWYLMREWLEQGGAIPDDQILADDLMGPEYTMTLKGKVKLESKVDMKARGVPSPNRGDALALSFAVPVFKKDKTRKPQWAQGKEEYNIHGVSSSDSKYDIYGMAA